MKKRYPKHRATKASKSDPFIEVRLEETKHPLAGTTPEERQAIRKELGEKIEKEYSRLIQRLEELMRLCNPLQVLAHFAFYDRALFGMQKGAHYQPVLQHSVEFFQAFFLTFNVNEMPVHETPIEILVELNEVLRGLESTYPLRGIDRPVPDDDSAAGRAQIAHHMRMHTYGVRNAGYFHQVMGQLRLLFGRMDATFHRIGGVKLSGLIEMNERIVSVVEARVRHHFEASFGALRKNSIPEVLRGYREAMNLAEDIEESMLAQCMSQNLNLEQARCMCSNHASLLLPQLYVLTLEDFSAVYPGTIDPNTLLAILVSWSHSPQELVGGNREHFYLNNPIWSRPIVRIGERTFFWPLVELFHSFGLEMMESLVRLDSQQWEFYQMRVRADFLEERVFELCQLSFPKAKVFRGSMWKDDAEGIEGENDILIVVDALAFAIECKSGRITPEARRGSPDRLRKEAKKLIEEAAKQSERFGKLLLRSDEVLRFPTKSGGANEVDASKISRVIRLNVTLDYFGPLACAVREMLDAKLIDSSVATSPTLALVDFETVLHVLETEIEKFHYFSRRADVERNITIFAGEEDLLACYLGTGLNLGQLEDGYEGRLNLGFMQKSLQPYLMAYDAGKPAVKPRRRFTNWWQQILKRLQDREFWQWTLSAFVFLDVRFEDQVAFEKNVKRLIKEVRSKWHDPTHMNKMFGTFGPSRRFSAICAVVLKWGTREQRDELVSQAVGHAFEEAKIQNLVVLCFKAEAPTWPYGALIYQDSAQYSELLRNASV